jgi:hypothetical protein
MKVYSGTGYGNGTMFVTPGTHYPENSDWVMVTQGDDGKTVRRPIQFSVPFRNGVAEVPESLGKYMIDRQMAKRSPVIIATPPAIKAMQDIALPHYAKPIAVGRPMNDVLNQAIPT